MRLNGSYKGKIDYITSPTCEWNKNTHKHKLVDMSGKLLCIYCYRVKR